jgi:hypothetical protein
MCERFICGDDLTDNDLADYDNGQIVPWRIAADGTQWYRRAGRPMIMGVPTPTVADFEDADDGDDEDGVIDADDGYFDVATGLDDFEKQLLQQWADDLRRGAADQDDGDANDE